MSENKQDENRKTEQQLNNDFLEILAELANVISMEEKYRAAGIVMKNTEALVKLRDRMNELQIKIDQGDFS